MVAAESVLPPLYRQWLEPVLGPVPGEPRATCSHCAMVSWPDQPPLEVAFSAQVKCCGYHPDVPNFNVGRILADKNPIGAESRRVIRARIADRVGVSPLSIATLPIYRTLYENAPSAFGKSVAMRCPYYVDQDGGLCGVWQHREAVCTTWFCKFDRGAVGRIYWRVIASLLGAIELSIKLWVIRTAGLDEEAQVDLWSRMEWEKRGVRPPLDDKSLANTVNLERYRKDWANFFGREEEFYGRCADIVNGLSSEDVMAIGGTIVAAGVNTAKYVFQKIGTMEIPERASAGGHVYMQIRKPGEVRIRHNGVPVDWLDLPESVAREIHRFEHGPVMDVLRQLQAEGVPIDEDLLRKLLEWQVLLKV